MELIYFSKLGITPDPSYWNVAGIPLTAFQFVLAIFITVNIAFLIKFIFKKQSKSENNIRVDIILLFFIYISTFLIWNNSPMLKHYFSIEPSPPNYQPFPYSDARVYDLGAISVNNGWGIHFGGIIDKPLYIGLLSIFHIISPNNYINFTIIQIAILSLITPFLFFFGRTFHSRFFGIFIALIVIIQQKNAIVLSHVVAGVNSKLFVTEIFTLFGLIILAFLLFQWTLKGNNKTLFSLLIGCILGLTSLIRLNPVILLPVISFFMLVFLWKTKKVWLFQNITFLVGFIIVISPWLLTGKDQNNMPYFFDKFTKVIQSRYSLSNTQLRNNSIYSKNIKIAKINRDFLLSEYINDHDFNENNMDFNVFPYFIINHSIHNIIGSFLILPDSINKENQNITTLVKRSYWQENQTQTWLGELDTGQLIFIIINLLIISFGFYWSWKRWKLAGLIPLMIFIAYCISLGLARNSGSRYIVPIDWIIYFYYSIGILYVLKFMFSNIYIGLKSNNDNLQHQTKNSKFYSPIIINISSIIVIIG
ncbi:hypothetical protein HN415_00355, partial [Candidatus Woesearchaeota archaeon]|nr:hypothetical protein [Candidatus Woesearchaeota archaeon]